MKAFHLLSWSRSEKAFQSLAALSSWTARTAGRQSSGSLDAAFVARPERNRCTASTSRGIARTANGFTLHTANVLKTQPRT